MVANNKKVISLNPPSAGWRFWDFTHGTNKIQEWYQELSEDAQNTFCSLLKNNQKVEMPIHWTGLRSLHGEARRHKIWELRFVGDRRAYRVLIYFGPWTKEATLLVGCYHKQGVYQPPACIDTAIKRKRMLEEGKATHDERKIAMDR